MGASSMEKISKIPIGVAPEDRERRNAIYSQMDVNGNNYLSLAEIDKGIRDVLELPELFDAKPVIIRAYVAAKGKVKGKKDFSDDYVSKAEFRYLLIYLKLYYHLWIEFDSIDKTGDRRISEAEFVAGQPILAKWGVCNSKVEAIFADLLKKNNAEGHITFTQFCDWAIGEHLRQHTDCDDHNSLG